MNQNPWPVRRLLLPVLLGMATVLLASALLAHASEPTGGAQASAGEESAVALPSVTPSPITVQVPILAYHSVGEASRQGINITAQAFAAQMDWLQQNGYTTVSLEQIAGALRGQAWLPPRPVALTFDDGWAQVYTDVVPVLLSHGFRGTFFIVAGYSSGRTPVYLSWEQVKAIHGAGMWIGSHSLTHPNLNKLNAVSLRRQVVESRTEIEQHIDGPVTVFSYPYGAYSLRVAQAVQEAGYVAAVAINPIIQQRADQIYRLNRITVSNMTMTRFELYLTGKAPPLPRLTPHRLPHPERDWNRICRDLDC